MAVSPHASADAPLYPAAVFAAVLVATVALTALARDLRAGRCGARA